jgi:hypothetical protein
MRLFKAKAERDAKERAEREAEQQTNKRDILLREYQRYKTMRHEEIIPSLDNIIFHVPKLVDEYNKRKPSKFSNMLRREIIFEESTLNILINAIYKLNELIQNENNIINLRLELKKIGGARELENFSINIVQLANKIKNSILERQQLKISNKNIKVHSGFNILLSGLRDELIKFIKIFKDKLESKKMRLIGQETQEVMLLHNRNQSAISRPLVQRSNEERLHNLKLSNSPRKGGKKPMKKLIKSTKKPTKQTKK